MTIVITSSLRERAELVTEAQAIAKNLAINWVERKKRSVKKLLQEYDAVLVLSQDKLVLHNRDGSSVFFHPDTAMLRIKSKRNPLLALVGSQPCHILDTTMGLASDSLVMAHAGHKVTALESNPVLHLLVSRGLASYHSDNAALDAAMRSIKTVCRDSLSYLKKQPDQSFDIIYCDPMFSETIAESDNLSGIKPIADYSRITDQWLTEAKRVARKKIIIKGHYKDTVFEDFGFERLVRPNQKFHYGLIHLHEEKPM